MSTRSNPFQRLVKQLGPGFLIAATGIGAGDMIAATVGGARYGTIIIWASIIGALLKYVLNEGIARWQLVTGSTLIHGWIHHFHRFVSVYFIGYLVIWSFIVASALMASCGLAAHAFFPDISVAVWGIIHSVIALGLVSIGRYQVLENLMKVFIALMFLTVLINLFFLNLDWADILNGIFIPRIPEGGTPLVLGIIGGVGGSVTLLCYGYWLKEKGWEGTGKMGAARTDLATAYGLTGLFGIAVILLAAEVSPELVSGSEIVLALANKLGETTGVIGKWMFMIGFWGAVFSSMLGVWSGVPYLFGDFVLTFKQKIQGHKSKVTVSATSGEYRLFLFFLAFPPMILLFLEKPVWIIILYAVAGAFFMPFLALMLLMMNNTIKWVSEMKNRPFYNLLLGLTMALFIYLLATEIMDTLSNGQ